MRIKFLFSVFCFHSFLFLSCKTSDNNKNSLQTSDLDKIQGNSHYSIEKIEWDSVSLLETKNKLSSFTLAMESNLKWLKRKKQDSHFQFGDYSFSTKDFICTSDIFLSQLNNSNFLEAKKLEKYFDLYKINLKEKKSVLYTGYYIPYTQASEVKTKKYNIPVYKTPEDLVNIHLGDFNPDYKGKVIRGRVDKNRIVPYWTREEIMEKKKLQNKELEVAWVNNKTDLFFIEIQGSGLLNFPDGSKKYIQYAQQNGREYNAIGSLLLKEGILKKENVSMQAIRQWLAANPKQENRILNYNKSFVFFNLEEEGPFGNIRVKLVGERSIAADQRFFPAGTLTLLEFPHPTIKTAQNEMFSQLAFVHDTGGAIKGPARIDVFWGEGTSAGELAGKTKQNGNIYVLMPKLKCNETFTAQAK